MFFELVIDASDPDALSHLIPQTYRRALSEKELRGVAVYENTLLPEKLVGVVLFREAYEWQRIEWIALTEKYADPQYGSDLIAMRCDAAAAAGSLYGSFADCPQNDKLFAQYLKGAGFQFLESESDIYEFCLKDMEGSGILQESLAKSVMPLGSLSDAQRQQAAAFMRDGRKAVPLPSVLRRDSYEQELSAVFFDGEVPCGILLLGREEEELCVEYFQPGPAVSLRALLSHAYVRGMEKYSAEQKILVLVLSGSAAALLEKLVPGAKRAKTQKALYPYRIRRKNPNVEKINSMIQMQGGEHKKAEGMQFGRSFPMADWVSHSGLALSTLYRKEEKNTDPLAGRLGMEVAMLEPEAGRVRKRMAAARGSEGISEERRKEETAHRKRERLERQGLGGNDPMQEEYRRLAQRGMELYLEGKAKPREIDGTEFCPYPASPDRAGIAEERLASALAYCERLRGQKKKGSSLIEKAEGSYETELADVMDRLAEAYFGAYGIPAGKEKGQIDEAECREKLPALLEDYRGLVTERKLRIALHLEKLLFKEKEFVKKLGVRSRESEKRCLEACEEDRKSYPGEAAGEKGARRIEELIDERNKSRRSLAAITDSIAAAVDTGLMGEYAEYLEEAHAVDIGMRKFFLQGAGAYLEHLSGGRKLSAVEGLFAKWHYKAKLKALDPDIPIERQAGELSEDFRKLSAWDYDNRGVLSAWSEWAERMGKHKKPDIRYYDESGIRRGWERLQEMRNEYAFLLQAPQGSALLDGIPEMFEMFEIAKRLRETGEPFLQEGELLEVKAIYRCLLRRSVYLSYIAEKSIKEAAVVQGSLYRASYREALGEIKEVWDADKDKR